LLVSEAAASSSSTQSFGESDKRLEVTISTCARDLHGLLSDNLATRENRHHRHDVGTWIAQPTLRIIQRCKTTVLTSRTFRSYRIRIGRNSERDGNLKSWQLRSIG